MLSAQLICDVDVLQAALLNSPRQRRKGQKGTPTMKGSGSHIISQCVMLAFYVPTHTASNHETTF